MMGQADALAPRLLLVLVSILLLLVPARAEFSYAYKGRTFTDRDAALAAHEADLDAELSKITPSSTPRSGRLFVLIPHPDEIRWLIPGNARLPAARLSFLISWHQQYYAMLGRATAKAHLVADAVVSQTRMGGSMILTGFNYIVVGDVTPRRGRVPAHLVWGAESRWTVGDGEVSAAAAEVPISDRRHEEQDAVSVVDAIRGTLLRLPTATAEAPAWNGERFDAGAIAAYAESRHRECEAPLNGMPPATAAPFRRECDCQWDHFAASPRTEEALTEFYRQHYPYSDKFNALLGESFKACAGPQNMK